MKQTEPVKNIKGLPFVQLKSNIYFAHLRDSLQVTSAHFARLPLIGSFLRLPYYFLVSFFALKLKEFIAVKAFYLKGSCARGDFYPGLSDLDICVILKSEHTSKEFISLAEFFIKLKQTSFFQLFDVLGEVEILTDEQLRHPDFDRYSAFYSWRLVWGSELIVSQPLLKEDQVAFARFKLSAIPRETVHIKQLSYQRRLQNVLRHTNLQWRYDEGKSREDNRQSVENVIEQCAQECAGTVPEPTELEQFYLRFQWRNHFVNTFGRSVWSRETREDLMKMTWALLADPLEQKKSLLWPAWREDSPVTLYQELRGRFL